MMDRSKEREETDTLEQEALTLGIDIPKNPDWWWDDGDEYSGPAEMFDYVVQRYLTQQGKAGYRRLIREERHKLLAQAQQAIEWERQRKQWTLTKWGLIIGWLLGIAGILISLFKN
jgi:hypothetical protein